MSVSLKIQVQIHLPGFEQPVFAIVDVAEFLGALTPHCTHFLVILGEYATYTPSPSDPGWSTTVEWEQVPILKAALISRLGSDIVEYPIVVPRACLYRGKS